MQPIETPCKTPYDMLDSNTYAGDRSVYLNKYEMPQLRAKRRS